MHGHFRRPLLSPTTRGVHHLALCTDDMKATIDFYVEVLGMPLVHAMKVPPGLGTGPDRAVLSSHGRAAYRALRRRSRSSPSCRQCRARGGGRPALSVTGTGVEIVRACRFLR